MKKVIAILAVLIMATSLFAASGDKIVVTSAAQAQKPNFVIYGSMSSITDANYKSANKGTADGKTFATEKDITLESITVYFGIAQDNSEKNPTWAKIAQTYTISIAATELALDANNKTNSPAFNDGYAVSSTAIGDGKGITSGTWTKASQSLALAYNGNKKVEDCLLGTFSLTWPQNAELAVGTYQATITMTVSPE